MNHPDLFQLGLGPYHHLETKSHHQGEPYMIDDPVLQYRCLRKVKVIIVLVAPFKLSTLKPIWLPLQE